MIRTVNSDTVSVSLQELVSGSYETRGRWDSSLAAFNAGLIQPRKRRTGTYSFAATRIEFAWDRVADTFGVRINGLLSTQVTKPPTGTVIPAESVMLGGFQAIYSATLSSDASFVSGDAVWAWLQRPVDRIGVTDQRLAQEEYSPDLTDKILLPVHMSSYTNPVSIDGPYKKTDDLTITDYVASGATKPDLSSGPNVAPFVNPHDRTELFATALRVCVMPDPLAPTNTSKVLSLIHI